MSEGRGLWLRMNGEAKWIITLVGALLTAAVAWANLASGQDDTNRRLSKIEDLPGANASRIQLLEQEIRHVREGMVEIKSLLRQVLEGLRER